MHETYVYPGSSPAAKGGKIAFECYSLFFYWNRLLRPSILPIHMLELCQHWAILDISENPKWPPAAILKMLFTYFKHPSIFKNGI